MLGAIGGTTVAIAVWRFLVLEVPVTASLRDLLTIESIAVAELGTAYGAYWYARRPHAVERCLRVMTCADAGTLVSAGVGTASSTPARGAFARSNSSRSFRSRPPSGWALACSPGG